MSTNQERPDEAAEELRQEEEAEPQEIRMMLVGNIKSGKSATGNTILQKKVFESKASFSPVTSECQKETGMFEGQPLAVLDTPGLFNITKPEEEEVFSELAKCVSLIAPGPHVFLVVVELKRFSEEEEQNTKILQKVFGETAADYSMVLFTHGDDLGAEETSIEELIGGKEDVRGFIGQCGGRYHVFNNRDRDPSQVEELLEKINKMMQNNGGRCFTQEMLQEARERTVKSSRIIQIIKRFISALVEILLLSRRKLSIREYIIFGAIVGFHFGRRFGRISRAVTILTGASVGASVSKLFI